MNWFRLAMFTTVAGLPVGVGLGTTSYVFAQQTQASLTGLIQDNTGSTIPGAQVEITNTDTNISRKVMSDSAGRYLVSNLNPGKYALRVVMAGFSRKELKGITLNVGAQDSLDVKLEIGAVTDVVDVQAEASVTNTESASAGSVITNQQVVGLPLNTRSFYGLALLSPAAYLPAQNSTLGFRGGFNVAGNNETANTFTVNGIDDNDQNVMAPSFRPSVEGIQEFKLLTGIYSAEYGRTSGGQVVVITKTGTNQFHGDLFEFIRNRVKNAFTLPGITPAFRRNQFGATLGGPLIKDRTFFFVNYEGLRLAQQIALTGAVPLTAWHNGNFSSLCTAGFNASGLCINTAQQLYRPTTPLAARVPYIRNQIASGDISPLGQRLINYFPAPDAATSSTYTLNRTRIENLDEISGRIDHKFGDHDTILAQYNYFNDPSFEPSNSLCGSSQLPGFGCYTNQRSVLAGLNYTHIFNEHWLNEVRIGWDRLVQPRTGEDASNGFPVLPGAFNDPANILPGTYGGTPNVTVSGYSALHPYTNLPQRRWDNHYNLVDNAQWTHGAHNFKFGVNILQARYSDYYIAFETGSFAFNSGSSSNSNVPTTGNSVADLLTGYAYSSTRSPSAPFIRALYSSYGGYAQDDWKISPYFTLNAGVRYEYFSPTRDAKNVIANINPSATPFSGYTAATPQQLSIQLAGTTGKSVDYVYNGDMDNFAPRLGLSWQPFHNDSTVVHAGFGTYFSSPAIGNGANLAMSLNVPFRLNQTFTSTPTAFAQLDGNPFPGSTRVARDTTTQFNYFPSATPSGIDQNFRVLYLNEYAADVQQQFSKALVLTVGYIGNEGARIPRAVNLNQGIVTGVTATATAFVRPYRSAGTADAVANTESYTNNACVSTYAQACYNNFGNVTYYISSGHSAYHALTLKAQQQYAHGLSFIAAYTWSKSIDNAPGYASGSQSSSGTAQDSHNLQAERGLSDFDVRHRLVLSPVYELPFGRNKPFLTHGFGAALAGGWQLSGIAQVSTGRPFTIANSDSNRSGSFNNVDRPNLVADPNMGPKTKAQWFNTAAFVTQARGTFGNAGRNILVGPGYVNVDTAVQRTFPIVERVNLLVRAEAFNIFNKVNYLNPLGTSTGALGAGSYGALTAANDPRQMQFSAKILF